MDSIAKSHQNVWQKKHKACIQDMRSVLKVAKTQHFDVMNTSEKNIETMGLLSVRHVDMPALQYQASTPLGSVITPHDQACQYYQHDIEGHSYPEVVTLT